MSSEVAAPQVVRSAAALIIGAELLSGKIRDENLHALSKTLRALGIELRRAVFCPDEREVIAEEIRAFKDHHDVIFTSGGVGPTHDDVTVEGIAAGLGLALEQSAEMERMLSKVYGGKTSQTHLRMARIPRGAKLTFGGGVRWPTIVAQNVWILPGVPELFRMKLAAVRASLRGPEPFFTHEVFCTLEETELKEKLDQLVVEYPEVQIGSYPKWFDSRYKTCITFDAREEQLATAARARAEELLAPFLVTLT